MLFLAHFWSIFPILVSKEYCPCTTSYGFLAPCQNLEKTNDKIPRKCPEKRKEGQKEGQKDGQTLFHRALLVTARRSKTGV